ncbi:MAG: FAD-dependent oxidoreductase [Pseudomonadota bacterium]
MKVFDTAVVGAGSVGVAVAYYLKQFAPQMSVVLLDPHHPLSGTSAASGENYRNWWPHRCMKQFIDRSLDLVDEIENKSNLEIVDTRNGYLLVSRAELTPHLLHGLESTFEPNEIKVFDSLQPETGFNESRGNGADIYSSRSALNARFPYLANDVSHAVHIRRGGRLSTGNLGTFMLDSFRSQGGEVRRFEVVHIDNADVFSLHSSTRDADGVVKARRIVNAAGPALRVLSEMVGVELPVFNVLQQKIAFSDRHRVISRDMPFTIDLDSQKLDWSDDERESIASDPELAFLAHSMPGSIHCRPDGGPDGTWIKLGWAFNQTRTTALTVAALDDFFPEVVLRGAARLHTGLKRYYGNFPREFSHYGGYYTMTDENWPLVSRTHVNDFIIAGAMSGFGSMAACAAGELAARLASEQILPDFAESMSLQRYDDNALMGELRELQSKGIL